MEYVTSSKKEDWMPIQYSFLDFTQNLRIIALREARRNIKEPKED